MGLTSDLWSFSHDCLSLILKFVGQFFFFWRWGSIIVFIFISIYLLYHLWPSAELIFRAALSLSIGRATCSSRWWRLIGQILRHFLNRALSISCPSVFAFFPNLGSRAAEVDWHSNENLFSANFGRLKFSVEMEYQNEIICIYFISYNVGVWVGFLQLYQTDLNQQKSESGFVC